MKLFSSDLTRQRWQRFRKVRRAWWSLWILSIAFVASLLSPWLVNDEPLLLHWEGKVYFPAFAFYPQTEFGGEYKTAPDYPLLLQKAKQDGLKVWALWPPIAHDPLRSRLETSGSPPYPPSSKHWLGTDAHGRDVLSRLIHGFRICMSFSLLLAFLGTFMGIVIGGLQGYLGGWWDILLQRGIEIWSSLPFLYVVLLVGSIYGRGFLLLLAIMSLFQWIGLSYYMRGEFLRLRNMAFVKAARVARLSGPKIFFSEMLPNALNPVITLFPFAIIGGISALTSLDFLGFGLQPPTPSWGELLAQGLNHLYAWWVSASTVLALFLTLLLSTFIGEGIRDAMDPKSGDRYE